MDKMTLTEIENHEAIITSHLDHEVVEIILKNGKEIIGIVDEPNEDYTEFTINGKAVNIEQVRNVYYQ